MSFQEHKHFGTVVVCDACSRIGAVYDRDWRQMKTNAQGEPIHLCRACRKTTVWCEAHQGYHQPTANHRCACAACGGLFTSVVQQGIKHCPSCRRSLPTPVALPAPTKRLPSLRSLFLQIGLLH